MEQTTFSKQVVLEERGRPARPLSYSLPTEAGLIRETSLNNRLRPFTRILLAVASLGMAVAFIMPLWNIYLEAPQYPEGLSMQLWLNKITGQVAVINELNHYIGMKKINADMFPEFSYMSYIVMLLMGIGIITSVVNRKIILVLFALLFVGFGVAGAIDFYNWEFDYGHNLDPHAAINIPGMTYQPPLLGTKQLLNFTATSIPGIGGYAIIFAGVVTAGLSFYEIFRKKK